MTIDMKRMSIDLTYRDPAVRLPLQLGDTRLLIARVITRDFFGSRTALALGAGWLGLILGLLVARY
jgi:hypothetical protein